MNPSAVTKKAGWNDPRIVQHQKLVTPKKGWQLGELSVLPFAMRTIKQQKARSVALRERVLRNPVTWKIVRKFFKPHRYRV